MPAEKLEILFCYSIKKQLQNIKLPWEGFSQQPYQAKKRTTSTTFIFPLLTTEMDKKNQSKDPTLPFLPPFSSLSLKSCSAAWAFFGGKKKAIDKN